MALGVATLFLGNLGSKAVGLIREILFAAWFGTGETAAAYRVAQTAYLLPTHALIGDALSAGLLPLYKAEQAGGADWPESGPERARVLVLVAAIYGLLFSAVVTPFLYLWSVNVVAFIAPGASGPALALASDLLRIMALATPFYVLSGMLSYLETAYGRYGGIAWRPMLLNIGSIAGAALAVWLDQDHWLATGILVSHIAFFLWTAQQLRRLDRLWPTTRPARALVLAISGRFLRNMLPLLGLPLAAQMTVLVERIASSWIGTEVIPSVDYARFICDTTVQLIAVPLGILTMSVHGGTSAEAMRDHVAQVAGTILLVAMPLGLFFAMNATDVVRLLFARGAFDAQSTAMTSAVMLWMAGALGMTVTAYYLVKAMNAQLRNRAALAFTVLASLVSITINLTLWKALGAQVAGVAVAAYATTLCMLTIHALGLWRPVTRLIPWILGGMVLQGVAGLYLRDLTGDNTSRLVLSAIMTVVIWLLLIALIRPLRTAATPVLSRLPGIRRLVG